MKHKNAYQRFVLPLATRMDAESAHERTIALLARAQKNSAGRSILRHIAGEIPYQPVDLFGLRFPNLLGAAAGFDKEGRVVDGLALLGFGHVEVGTITPAAQAGNPRPRIFRLPEDGAIINRMGFPSSGAIAAVEKLKAIQPAGSGCIVGVSLGKQKDTPLAEAIDDYDKVLRMVFPYADYLAINISSPNTPELRQLQGRRYLSGLIDALANANRDQGAKSGAPPKPLLVKIAPDLTDSELDDILDAIVDSEISGLIATNSTTARDGLQSRNKTQSGGLSGLPLAQKSLAIVGRIARQTGGRLPIIAVGGIFSTADVRARLDAGASLVQIYTGLIYKGPGLAGQILRELAARRERD